MARLVKVKRRRRRKDDDEPARIGRKKKRHEFPPNFFDFLDEPEYDDHHYPTTGWKNREVISEKDVSKPKFSVEEFEFKGKAIRKLWAVTGVTKLGIPFIMLTPLRGDTARVFNNSLCSNQCDPSTATLCAVVAEEKQK